MTTSEKSIDVYLPLDGKREALVQYLLLREYYAKEAVYGPVFSHLEGEAEKAAILDYVLLTADTDGDRLIDLEVPSYVSFDTVGALEKVGFSHIDRYGEKLFADEPWDDFDYAEFNVERVTDYNGVHVGWKGVVVTEESRRHWTTQDYINEEDGFLCRGRRNIE